MTTADTQTVSRKIIASKTLRQMFQQRALYLMLLVPFAVYFLFNYVPMVKIYWAFTNFGEVAPSKVTFVGFKNFETLLMNSGFLRSFRNTIIISLYNTLIGFPIPIIIALMLNEIQCRWFKRASQTIIYLPHFLSWVVIGSVWYMILAPQFSINSEVSELLGKTPIYYFASNDYIRSLLVFTNIWQGAGYGAIVYLAALSGVDPELYEAATIDGAGKWQQIVHVSLPCIASTIVVMLILGLGKILNIFTQVIVMCNPIVYEKSDVIQTFAYRMGIQQGKIGFSMAVSVFKAAISFVLVIITDKAAKRIGQDGIF